MDAKSHILDRCAAYLRFPSAVDGYALRDTASVNHSPFKIIIAAGDGDAVVRVLTAQSHHGFIMVPALSGLDHSIIRELQRDALMRVRRSHYGLGNQVDAIGEKDSAIRICINDFLYFIADILRSVRNEMVCHNHIAPVSHLGRAA